MISMYNRYIPRPDGSYQKSRLPDRSDTRPSQPRQERREQPRQDNREQPRQDNREQPKQKIPDPEPRKPEEACDSGENRKDNPASKSPATSLAHPPARRASFGTCFPRTVIPVIF